MKLLAFSDIHLDAHTAGRARRSEIIEYLARVYEIASRNNVDIVAFGGDAHDSGNALDPLYAADLIRCMAAYIRMRPQVMFVAIPGNHDVVDTSEFFLGGPVTTLTPMRSAVAAMVSDDAARVHILDRPYARYLRDGWAVLGLPYVSRVHLRELEGWDAHAFEQARKYIDAGAKLIVIGHRVIPGAQMSSESIEMARGAEQIFPFEAVAKLNPALVINGHYHSQQVIDAHGLRIFVPGSPLRFTFGEANQDEKGVLLAELPG